MQQFGVAW